MLYSLRWYECGEFSEALAGGNKLATPERKGSESANG
jgi:hypothetical protein